jgi:hypothetical protein
MNSYQLGVNHALGIDANIGTPNMLFHPANFKGRLPAEYLRRKLSTQDIVTLLHINPSTVHIWRQKGWLKGRRGAKRTGWRKFVYWRHSLKDLENCLMVMKTRKRRESAIEFTWWTPQEINILLQGEKPEGRSPLACRVMRCRLRKQGGKYNE